MIMCKCDAADKFKKNNNLLNKYEMCLWEFFYADLFK